jgi:hypothetical protein
LQRTKVRHRSASACPDVCDLHGVKIDVRPTSALRRHRARLVGTVLGVAMLTASGLAVAELTDASAGGPEQLPVSDPTHP